LALPVNRRRSRTMNASWNAKDRRSPPHLSISSSSDGGGGDDSSNIRLTPYQMKMALRPSILECQQQRRHTTAAAATTETTAVRENIAAPSAPAASAAAASSAEEAAEVAAMMTAAAAAEAGHFHVPDVNRGLLRSLIAAVVAAVAAAAGVGAHVALSMNGHRQQKIDARAVDPERNRPLQRTRSAGGQPGPEAGHRLRYAR